MSKVSITPLGGAGSTDLGVGSIVVNVRDNLGEKYIPCDGRTVFANQYPALHAILPESPALTEAWLTSSAGVGFVNSIVYFNGYWIVSGQSSPYIVYSRALVGPWTTLHVPQTGTSQVRLVNADGALYAYSTNEQPCILYRMTGTTFGAWETATQFTGYGTYTIWYLGGYFLSRFYPYGDANKYYKFFYKQGPSTDGDWMPITYLDNLKYDKSKTNPWLRYNGGRWICWDNTGYQSSIYTCLDSNPSGNWVSTGLTTSPTSLATPTFFDGYFVNAYQFGTKNVILKYTAGSEDSTHEITLWTFSSGSTSASNERMYCSVVNGQLVVMGSGKVFTVSPTGDPAIWKQTVKYAAKASASNLDEMNGFAVTFNSSSIYYLPYERAVPHIDLDTSHAFVRAKP